MDRIHDEVESIFKEYESIGAGVELRELEQREPEQGIMGLIYERGAL